MVTYTTPGVYIQEIPATGPIAGVGTSTAAFVGPTAGVNGRINVPTLVTSWTQYKKLYGGYSALPRLYLPYAVRGFFDNGGTLAYIVRVGNAATAFLELPDRGTPTAGLALRVEAKTEGLDGNSLQVEVRDAPLVTAAKVVKMRAAVNTASANSIKLLNPDEAKQFRPGDMITIEGSTELAAIERTLRAGELLLAKPLTASFAAPNFVRIADLGAANANAFRLQNYAGIQAGSVVHIEQSGGAKGDYVVENMAGDVVTLAGAGLTGAYKLDSASPDVIVASYEFTLVFTRPGLPPEVFANLSMDPRHSRYYGAAVNSALVNVMPPTVPSVQNSPNNTPKAAAATALGGGVNDNPATVGPNTYDAALAGLEKVDGINMVCAPDGAGNAVILGKVRDHCQRMQDRFGILDAGPASNLPDPGTSAAVSLRPALDSDGGYAALYFPWIRITDPQSASGNDTLLVPPSGHLAGIYARADTQRGVHKAPANMAVTSALDLERILNDTDQGVINDLGINALRIFPGQALPLVWGARTTAPSSQVAWRYINVRRLFLFVEKSIQSGIRWAVFEPNDRSLWKKLERTISEFLTRVWRSGALFGQTAKEAFYVKIDDELNPPDVQALGQLFIEIGIAPVRPAEFVIVRLGMWDGGGSVNEG